MNSVLTAYRRYIPAGITQLIPESLRKAVKRMLRGDPGQRTPAAQGDVGSDRRQSMYRSVSRSDLRRLTLSDDLARTQERIRRDKSIPFEARALWNVMRRSEYAYGIYHAARLAKRLGHQRISVMEFGVAGGKGLLAMEDHARSVEKMLSIGIDIYGFDTGEGLTPPQDYRDMPYMFAAGNYRMDVELLRSRLTRATLVLGDVKETVPRFLGEYRPSPIGFVSFDLDYYSSTMDAFRLLGPEKGDEWYLPRIYLYFDDMIGSETQAYCQFTGELAAIDDFNSANDDIKIAENRVFRNYSLNFNWYHQSYVMHRFRHRDYATYVSKASAGSLSLT